MSSTTPRGVPYPDPNDPNDVPAHMQDLAEWVDLNAASHTHAPFENAGAWSSTTGTPTIGNGSVTYAWSHIGRKVTLRITLIVGSTTNLGGPDGSWSFTASPPPATTELRAAVGAWVISTGPLGAPYSGVAFLDANGGIHCLMPDGNQVGDLHPYAMAAGDRLSITVSYEAATLPS